MIEVDKVGTLYIGHTGENDAEMFAFDYSAWVKRYGEGQLLLSVKRSCDNMPYPATLDIKGDIATWIVKKVDVSAKGTGVAEFTYKVNNIIKKSAQFRFVVLEAFDGNTAVPADPDSWLNAIIQKVLEGQGYADEAKKAAEQTNLDAIATENDRVIVAELAKAVDADAKEVASNKATVVEAQKAVDLAEQRMNTAVEDVRLMQLDVSTNKNLVDAAKTEVVQAKQYVDVAKGEVSEKAIQVAEDAAAASADRVVVENSKTKVVEDAKQVGLALQLVEQSAKDIANTEVRINSAEDNIKLIQLDVQTNKDTVNTAKAEVDGKAAEVANNAKAVGINAAATEENARAAQTAKNDAVAASSAATEAAKQAELSVNKGGYVYFNIKNGHLFFTRTETSEFDFKLEEGRLIAYAK